MWFSKDQTVSSQQQVDPYLGPIARGKRQEPVFDSEVSTDFSNPRPTTIDIDVASHTALPKAMVQFQPKAANQSSGQLSQLSGQSNPANIVSSKPHTPKVTPAALPQETFTLPADVTIEGKIQANKAMTIAGILVGNIAQCEQLLLLPSGVINGNINCHSAEISGTITGALNVVGLCIVRATAHITGPINYGMLRIEDGAVVNGTLTQLNEK